MNPHLLDWEYVFGNHPHETRKEPQVSGFLPAGHCTAVRCFGQDYFLHFKWEWISKYKVAIQEQNRVVWWWQKTGWICSLRGFVTPCCLSLSTKLLSSVLLCFRDPDRGPHALTANLEVTFLLSMENVCMICWPIHTLSFVSAERSDKF